MMKRRSKYSYNSLIIVWLFWRRSQEKKHNWGTWALRIYQNLSILILVALEIYLARKGDRDLPLNSYQLLNNNFSLLLEVL